MYKNYPFLTETSEQHKGILLAVVNFCLFLSTRFVCSWEFSRNDYNNYSTFVYPSLFNFKWKCIITETCCKRMLQEMPCQECHTQALFLICDGKHDKTNPIWKATRLKNVSLSAECTVNYSHPYIVNKTSRQPERGKARLHRLKGSALVEKGTNSATNSSYGNNEHVMFLILRPEL